MRSLVIKKEEDIVQIGPSAGVLTIILESNNIVSHRCNLRLIIPPIPIRDGARHRKNYLPIPQHDKTSAERPVRILNQRLVEERHHIRLARHRIQRLRDGLQHPAVRGRHEEAQGGEVEPCVRPREPEYIGDGVRRQVRVEDDVPGEVRAGGAEGVPWAAGGAVPPFEAAV